MKMRFSILTILLVTVTVALGIDDYKRYAANQQLISQLKQAEKDLQQAQKDLQESQWKFDGYRRSMELMIAPPETRHLIQSQHQNELREEMERKKAAESKKGQ